MDGDNQVIAIAIHGENLILDSLRIIYLPDHNTMVCSDVHLGKMTHFRKAGFGVPQQVGMSDIENLNTAIVKYHPKTVLIVGDLFHASLNQEWVWMEDLIDTFSDVKFILVKGNHDIISSYKYEKSNLELVEDMSLGQLYFTHQPTKNLPLGQYNICGHIHPGVIVSGGSKQTHRIPCFYFSEGMGILPAFGKTTGTAIIQPVAGDQVIGIVNETLIHFNKEK